MELLTHKIADSDPCIKMLDYSFPAEWEYLELYNLSDLHIGDPNADLIMFRNFVRYIQAAPNRFLTYNGDNMNNAVKSGKSNVYQETMPPNDQRKWLQRHLEPIADRFLVFVEGNHEFRSKRDSDTSPVEFLADYFRKPYVETAAGLIISLGKGANGKRVTYGGYITHGVSGGRKPGASINSAEDLAKLIAGVDFVVVGHSHKKTAHKFDALEIDYRNKRLRQVEKLCAVSSSWVNYGGYGQAGLYTPSSKGSVPIILSGREKSCKALI